MKSEKIVLNKERNVTLTTYLQEVGGEFRNIPKRPAVLVLPGGGYSFCSDREAEPVALPYLQAGFQAFILRYSVKEDAKWPNPLRDYEQAMALIRKNADLWNLYPDKIAVIGFSAGGHLAGCAATMADNKPNAAILGYAVLGEDAKGCLIGAPDAIEAVDVHTCPCFVFATRTDNVVPVDNSTRFICALADAGVAFESHIYSFGPHGCSTADSGVQSQDGISARAHNWVADSIGWLRECFGDFADGTLGEPAFAPRVNADDRPHLSVDCSFGRLMRIRASKEILSALFAKEARRGREEGAGNSLLLALAAEGEEAIRLHLMARNMTLRDICRFGGTAEADIESIDTRLRNIKNEI